MGLSNRLTPMTQYTAFLAPGVDDVPAASPAADHAAGSKSSLRMLMAQENALEYGSRVLVFHGVDPDELAAWEAARRNALSRDDSP